MNPKSDEFSKKLLETFREEAEDHLKNMSSGLLDLEKNLEPAKQKELIEIIFREAHSLKGAARAVNLADTEKICQSLESLFSAIKAEKLGTSKELFDLLHHTLDNLKMLISHNGDRAGTSGQVKWIQENLERLDSALQCGVQFKSKKITEHGIPPPAQSLTQTAAPAETVRISTSKVDAIFVEAEELLSTKLALAQRIQELKRMHNEVILWREKADLQGPEFLEKLKLFSNQLESVKRSVEQDQRLFSRMVDSLLESAKSVLMLRFASLFEIFPKYVRDLAQDCGKQVELQIYGSDYEIDKRILEEMKDPFIHLVRNCVDHGIERPQERLQKNKPPAGKIVISVVPKEGNKVEITISDDGGGIDLEKVKTSALKAGLITAEQVNSMSEKELTSLIYRSGISTSPLITDLSGRGIGLAIVQDKIEKLGGTISVTSYPNAGTTFQMMLPMTLATFKGVLIRTGQHFFVIPTTHVQTSARIKKTEIQTIENKETIILSGKPVSLVRLDAVLELPHNGHKMGADDFIQVVVLGAVDKRIAFLVDEVLQEQEVVVKGLGKQLLRVKNISGATVLGSGKVVPVLNVTDLVKSALAIGAVIRPEPLDAREFKKHKILVVEDSITARTLIRNILETAGYEVETAVDGIDGFTQLRSNSFDLVVSDVDMPRMNGFDLTQKIRSDKKLAEVPVVLVTALESKEDRERGMDVGANAYIIKRSFDQSNLLDVVKKLIV